MSESLKPVRPVELVLGGDTFELRWDFNALATLQDLTGDEGEENLKLTARTLLQALYATIDAGAAAKDEPCPITLRRLGSLISPDNQEQVLERLSSLIRPETVDEPAEGDMRTPADSGKEDSTSESATSSPPSTSALASASSGG